MPPATPVERIHMSRTTMEDHLRDLRDAEQAKPWKEENASFVVRLLNEVADLFWVCGDALASETAIRMGVTETDVWLETIFPSVWGLLSAARGIGAATHPSEPLSACRLPAVGFSRTRFAGQDAIQLLPNNAFERCLLPGFRGYALMSEGRSRTSVPPAEPGLALCLLPFNLASIGVLDIVHLLCSRQRRVVAKISERVEFIGPHLERILRPLIAANALRLVYGGPDVGAALSTNPSFSHIHSTGSISSGRAVTQAVGSERLSMELGGVTLAIIFPDALGSSQDLRQVARQVAFGALANNGQHCVSFQVAIVPAAMETVFSEVLWREMIQASRRDGGDERGCELVDAAAAHRLEAFASELKKEGARLTPINPRASSRMFPATLVQGIHSTMAVFKEEAFGPIIGVMSLPEIGFGERALELANSSDLTGDLGLGLFTATPDSSSIRKFARQLRHGIVAINTYPGVAFAMPLPWGAGRMGLSGSGWVHNYWFLPEQEIEKVVLTAPLGRKGLGPLKWEDPWLLNVSGANTVAFAKALVGATLGYFQKRPSRFVIAQAGLLSAMARRERQSRRMDHAQ